jgi:hypothetical protein
VEVDLIVVDEVITSYTCVPKNSVMTPKTPPKNPYTTGPKDCPPIEDSDSCHDNDLKAGCDSGFCGRMESATHCHTPICVPEILYHNPADSCPECSHDQECGEVVMTDLDMEIMSKICVPKNSDKLIKPKFPKSADLVIVD